MTEIQVSVHGHAGSEIHAWRLNGTIGISGAEQAPGMGGVRVTLFPTPEQARQIIDVLERHATPRPEPVAAEAGVGDGC